MDPSEFPQTATLHTGEQSLRSIDRAAVVEWHNGSLRRLEDSLAAEEPLEIRAGTVPVSVTMRTLGDNAELAAGFLFTEGLIQGRHQIASIHHDSASVGNTINVELAGVTLDRERLRRNFVAVASCGVCGKDSIDSIMVPGLKSPNREFRIDPEMLCTFPEKLHAAQKIFGSTGGLHAAALFDSKGDLAAIREDIGRHNAVDKVVGWALLAGRSLANHTMMISGRGGFEIVQKALAAGLPAVACVSAPSSLAVRMSRDYHLTLVGFLRGRRFVVYAGEDRLALGSDSARP